MTASASSGNSAYLQAFDGVRRCFVFFEAPRSLSVATINGLQTLGPPFSAGQCVNAQTWFRDPPAPGTTNLSDGLQFVTAP